MIKAIVYSLCAICIAAKLPAQTAKPVDPKSALPAATAKALTPFQGQIGYRLSYKNFPADLQHFLPDSMTLWSNPPMIRITYHGGMSDSLRTEMQWDASQYRYYMIDQNAKTAWLLDDQFQVPVKLPLKSIATDSLLGMNCKVFEIPVTAGKDRYSVSDSIHFPFLPQDSLIDSLRHFVPPFLMPGQQCIPLRTIRTTPQGTVEARAISIQRGLPDPSIFRMPSGFDVKPFDPRPRFHPLVPKPLEPGQ